MNLPRVFFSRKGAFIAMTERNLTMLTDFYEFTMANGYFEKGMGNRRAYFDMFFRRVPDGGGYAIMAGVEQLISYFKNLRFTEEDIAYLRRRKCFSERFSTICATSSSNAMSGLSPRARRYSRASRSSPLQAR